MRLHELTVTGFGPFPDRVRVDFDRLHDAGLFLLTGPTGAGKTSLLDAVVFALYGVVPGARQGAGRLRSDHAAADTAPEVRLELTCRDRRLRVTRTAAWDRPKRRGTGTVREQARVLLEELDCGEGRVLSTRLDEAGQLLRDILGMSAEQFCQVVLLPQGEFARFLRADADARRTLLQTLFATDRFGTAEALLAERRRRSAHALELLEQEQQVLLARVAQAAGRPQPEVAPDDPQDWARELAVQARAAADTAAVMGSSARNAAREARESLDDARALAAQIAAARALDLRRSALALASGERAAGAEELGAARRAASVAPLLDARRRADGRARRCADDEAAARDELSSELRGLPADDLRERARTDRDEHVRLEHLVAEVGLDARVAELDRAADEERVTAARLDLVRERRDELECERTVALRTAEEASAAAARLAGLEPEQAALAARLDAAHRRDALIREHAQAVQVELASQGAVLDARSALLDARAARLAGLAAELAAELEPGVACPVCGALEHPSPAAAAPVPAAAAGGAAAGGGRCGGAAVGGAGANAAASAEETAQEALDRAAQAREAALDRLHALATELAAATALSRDEPVTAMAQRSSELAALAAGAGLVAARLPSARLALQNADEQLQTLDREKAALERARAALVERCTALAAAVAAAAERLAAARGDDASVPLRLERLAARVRRAERAADLAEEAARAADQAEEAATEEARAATLAGFASPAAAAAARREPSAVARLEARLRELDEEAARVAERLADEALADGRLEALLALPAPDVSGAEPAAHGAQVLAERATAEEEVARRRTRELEELCLLVDEVAERLAPAREEHRVLDRLSRLVEGSSVDNALRMRLSAFVLAARLEQVAAAASERLHRMTSGRYSLVHTDAGAGGRGRSGLGLAVVDAWTGVDRDPATLSGGEAFSASLALALGLADVVTAEAGGVLVESLFVDEGFGSLDEESLDEVLDVLDGLREGGRSVGVVSHVAELRSRIPAQVRLEKARHGSSVKVVGVPDPVGVAA